MPTLIAAGRISATLQVGEEQPDPKNLHRFLGGLGQLASHQLLTETKHISEITESLPFANAAARTLKMQDSASTAEVAPLISLQMLILHRL
jgi:hypothetical protein